MATPPLPSQCATALLNALSGAPWKIAHGSPEHIADPSIPFDDDVGEEEERLPQRRVERALAFAHGQTIAARATAAIAADQSEVRLASGERLARDAADHALFLKEEKRVFEPLRQSIDQALGAYDGVQSVPFSAAMRQAGAAESDTLPPAPPLVGATDAKKSDAEESEANASERRAEDPQASGDGDAKTEQAPSSLDIARGALEQLLSTTEEAFAGAVAALEGAGGVPLSGASAIGRALDLGFVDGAFATERHLALSGALKQGAQSAMGRPIVRTKAPRDLAGHVVTAAPGPIRVLSAPTLRARRFLDVTLASGAAIGASVMGEDGTAGALADSIGRSVGGACALGLFSPTVLRAISGESQMKCERDARTLRAILVVKAVLQAQAASVYCELLAGWDREDKSVPAFDHSEEGRAAAVEQAHEREEELLETARSAVAQRMGDDVGAPMIRALLAPPLPGSLQLSGRLLRAGSGALGVAAAVSLTLSLRDRFDEAFALIPNVYEQVADARAPLLRGAVHLLQLFDVERSPGAALSEWMLELA